MRLDKYLSLSGYTRRDAKRLVADRRVHVGGVLMRDASLQVLETEKVFLDGQPLRAEQHLHLMLHKPAGVITATTDAHGKRTVMDLVPPMHRRRDLGPVGRLDKDVTGLVILTTDGQLAHRLISPKWAVEKQYRAMVEGALTEADVSRMRQGVALKDFVAKPARLTILQSGDTSLAELRVTEGKYHQVKRMFGALAHPVIDLQRLSIGGITLDATLLPGECRALSAGETAHLYQLVDLAIN